MGCGSAHSHSASNVLPTVDKANPMPSACDPKKPPLCSAETNLKDFSLVWYGPDLTSSPDVISKFAETFSVQKPEDLPSTLAWAQKPAVVILKGERYRDVSSNLESNGYVAGVFAIGGNDMRADCKKTFAIPQKKLDPDEIEKLLRARYGEYMRAQRFVDEPSERVFLSPEDEISLKLKGSDLFFSASGEAKPSDTIKALDRVELAAKSNPENAEIQSVLRYAKEQTELGPRQALAAYTFSAGLGRMLNEHMRARDETVAEYAKEMKRGIYEFGSAILETRTAVYRGIRLGPKLLSDFEARKGECVLLGGFLSTTLSKELALSFSSNEGKGATALLEILLVDYDDELESGLKRFGLLQDGGVVFPASIARCSVCEEEKEVLFPPFYPAKVVDVGTEIIGGRVYQKVMMKAPKCVQVSGRQRLDKSQPFSTAWKRPYVETMLQLCERRTITRLGLVDLDFMKDAKTFSRVMSLVKTGNCAELLVEQAAVADTQIARIIRECKRSLGTLRRLSLNNAKLGVYGVSLIAQMLAGNGMLEVLELAGNDTKPFGAKAIMGGLVTNNALIELNMMNTNIGDEDSESIGIALTSNKTLAMLNVSHNKMTVDGLANIAKALEKNEFLLSLDASYNDYERAWCSAEPSLANNSTLVSLNLDTPKVATSPKLNMATALNALLLFQQYKANPSKYSERRRRAIEEVLDYDTDRTVLDLKGAMEGGIDKVAAVLQVNQTITTLIARRTEQVFKVLSGLTGNRVLKTLDLAESKLAAEEQLLLTGILTSDTALTAVNLSDCNIDMNVLYFIMLALQVNTTLKKVNLSGNNGGNIDLWQGVLGETLNENKTLVSLDLSRIPLGDKQAVPLVLALCGNTSLSVLKLDQTGIGAGTFRELAITLTRNKTLTKLYASENQVPVKEFMEFCQSLGENVTLTHLRISADLPDEEIDAFSSALKINKGLTGLRVQGKTVKDRFAEAVAAATGANTSLRLKTLKFRGSEITPRASEGIGRIIANSPDLVRVDFHKLGMSSGQFAPVAAVLMENKTVTHLSLRGCELDEICVIKLLSDLLKANSTIQYMNLRSCHIEEGWAPELFSGVKVNKGVKTLYLDDNFSWRDTLQSELPDVLMENSTLTTLYVDGPFGPEADISIRLLRRLGRQIARLITPDGTNHMVRQNGVSVERWRRVRKNLMIKEIEENLASDSTESLDLVDFYMDLDGMKTLAERLKNDEKIKELGIFFSNSSFGDEFAILIGEMFAINKTITGLFFGGNGIGTDGIGALARVLERNDKLESMRVAFENLGDRGAKCFAEVLKTNKTLRTLAIKSCNIGNEGAVALCEALAVNKSLKELQLGNNRIGSEGARRIVETMARAERGEIDIMLKGNPIGKECVEMLRECPATAKGANSN